MKAFLAGVIGGVLGALAWGLVGPRQEGPATGGDPAPDDGRALARLEERIDAVEERIDGLFVAPPADLAPVTSAVSRDVSALEARLSELERRAAHGGSEPVGASAGPEGKGGAEDGEPGAQGELAPARSAEEVILDPGATDEEKLEAHRSLRRVADAYTPGMIDALVDVGRTATDPDVRASTWTMFDGSSHLPELVPDLSNAALQDPAPAVRREAAETLGNYVDDPLVRELLEGIARDDPSKEVRDRAKRTLREDG